MQPQTLDSIFSPATVSSTANSNQPSQSLESIFSTQNTPESRPSLDSVFNPTPPTPPSAEEKAIYGANGKPETSFVQDVGSNFKSAVDTGVQNAAGIEMDIGKNLKDTFSQMGPESIKNPTNFWDQLGSRGLTLGHVAAGLVNLFGNAAGTLISSVVPKAARDTVSQGINALGTGLMNKDSLYSEGINKLNEFLTKQDNPDVTKALTEDLPSLAMALIGGGKSGAGALDEASLKNAVSDIKGGGGDLLNKMGSGAQTIIDMASKGSEMAGKIKEGIKPSLTSEEATGQIVQGKTEDVSSAQRTLGSIDTTGVKIYADLQSKINGEIKPLADQVDVELAKDPTLRPISSFTKTVGEGANATKINYVNEALNGLKELYANTSDAKGLSEIKALETKVDGLRDTNGRILENATGLTNKDVNDISRLYGSEFKNKAFSKVSGDPLTSVNAQKFENIRSGLKETARQGLGGAEAKALDAKLSDLYDTKALIDKQVEKVNSTKQKTPKVGIIPKTVGTVVKTIDTITGNPLKSIGKAMGTTGSAGTLSPVELEENLARNLKIIRGK